MKEKMILLENEIYFDFSKAYIAEVPIDKHMEMMDRALKDLEELEAGKTVNKEEDRMVGHYWLRDPEAAPSSEIESEIMDSIRELQSFSSGILEGKIVNENGESFIGMIYAGIGGSALGPQLVCDALKNKDSFRIMFLDNTDPQSIYELIMDLGDDLQRYLIVSVSKSGGTRETANIQNELSGAFIKKGWSFSSNAVAITVKDSKLDRQAEAEGWLKVFHIWDWVGGRTSVSSAVGLLPMLLLKRNAERFLAGLRFADQTGRKANNPILLMALDIYLGKEEAGKNQLVILPYKDRLHLFAKYLQQLIMESLGKEFYKNGRLCHEGIAVYGNKGSSDQHSYLQQLFDGPDNFSVNFINVRDSGGLTEFLPDGNLSADYLQAFSLGTAKALYAKGRNSAAISIPEVDEFCLGFLIGVYERIVSFHGSFAGINAYHQPAVEKGKKAAAEMILQKNRILEVLRKEKEKGFSAEELAEILEADKAEIFSLLEYISGVDIYRVERIRKTDDMDYRNIRYRAKM